jgi:hypothetical protein
MAYKVIPTSPFLKEFNKLKKRHHSLKEDVLALADSLAENPELGKPLGHNLYKIRLSIKSKGKGKSGGARVITYLINAAQEVYLVSIYDKTDMDSVSTTQLKKIVDKVFRK